MPSFIPCWEIDTTEYTAQTLNEKVKRKERKIIYILLYIIYTTF